MRSTVLVVLAACGGGGGGVSPTDSHAANTLDAPAAPTDVNVTTYVRCCGSPPLTPQAGVIVVAIDPGGNVIDGTSDSTGHVTLANVQPNSTVYAGYPESDTQVTWFITVIGVNPGAHLVFGEKFGPWDSHGTNGSMTVNLPAYAGADGYRVSSACSSIPDTSTTITFPVIARCQSATTTLSAVATMNYVPIATSYATNAPFTPGAVYTAGPWIPSTPINVSITGFAGSITVFDGGIGSLGQDGASVQLTPTNGAATGSMLAPRSTSGVYLYGMPDNTPSGMGKHQFATKVAVDATQASLSDPGIPWVGDGNGTDTAFSWNQTSGVYDTANVVTSWAHKDASSVVHYLTWSVIMPSTVTSYPWMPTLPAELAPFMPTDLSNTSYGAAVTLADFGNATTYDEALANPEWAIEVPINATLDGDIEGGVAVAHGTVQ